MPKVEHFFDGKLILEIQKVSEVRMCHSEQNERVDGKIKFESNSVFVGKSAKSVQSQSFLVPLLRN